MLLDLLIVLVGVLSASGAGWLEHDATILARSRDATTHISQIARGRNQGDNCFSCTITGLSWVRTGHPASPLAIAPDRKEQLGTFSKFGNATTLLRAPNSESLCTFGPNFLKQHGTTMGLLTVYRSIDVSTTMDILMGRTRPSDLASTDSLFDEPHAFGMIVLEDQPLIFPDFKDGIIRRIEDVYWNVFELVPWTLR